MIPKVRRTCWCDPAGMFRPVLKNRVISFKYYKLIAIITFLFPKGVYLSNPEENNREAIEMNEKQYLSIERLLELSEEKLEEPRRTSGNYRHKLVDVFVISLLGIMTGLDNMK